MVFFLFGYAGAAAGFYYLISKTAKVQPELVVVSNTNKKTAKIIEIGDQVEKRAA